MMFILQVGSSSASYVPNQYSLTNIVGVGRTVYFAAKPIKKLSKNPGRLLEALNDLTRGAEDDMMTVYSDHALDQFKLVVEPWLGDSNRRWVIKLYSRVDDTVAKVWSDGTFKIYRIDGKRFYSEDRIRE